ncbi:tetratricopeptide repeat protein [[Limnothrix rosea] IAM M-220]|uniref:tetratricopeptide repeat protein n=1 Tax=[Limnothrix rosea] IAM M-220 TaxID=454133 RepID=UPI001CED222A|nr:tetratricopeptide repeat protein [[Limnothrix rosea] IAM M-220]
MFPLAAEGRSPQVKQSSSFPVITPTTPAAKEKMSQGLQQVQQGQLSQGIRLFNEAIALDPALWQAHYNLGLALRQSGDLQGAANAFYQTVVLQPNFALGYASVGGILTDVQNWSQAQQYLELAIAIEPNLALAHYNLGLIHRQFGRVEAAVQAWETARRLTPELNEASLQLAEVYLNGDRLKEATTLTNEVLSRNSRLATAHYLQGRIAAARGNSEAALTSFRTASQIDPNYANAYLAAAKILIRNERQSAAQPLLDYALLLYTQQGQTGWAQVTRELRQQL